MHNKQKELESFTSKGKQLLCELKKIRSSDYALVKTDKEGTVDRWLDVSSSPAIHSRLGISLEGKGLLRDVKCKCGILKKNSLRMKFRNSEKSHLLYFVKTYWQVF